MNTPRSTAAILIAALLSSAALAVPQQQQVAERDREVARQMALPGWLPPTPTSSSRPPSSTRSIAR